MATENKKEFKKKRIHESFLIEDPEFQDDPIGEQKIRQNQNVEDAQIKVRDHEHNGQDASKIQIGNLEGFFEIVSTAPTHRPKNMFEQIKLYVNGATYRIYFYDYKARAWRFA